MNARAGLFGLIGAFVAIFVGAPDSRAQTFYDVEVVAERPHDPTAFTQGLFIKDGRLYETTGIKGRSSLREIDLDSGEIIRKIDLGAAYFGEGSTAFGDRIIALTWRSQTGFVYDRRSFRQLRRFTYVGEGWGLTTDGRRLIMSDGTDELRFLDPRTLKETGRLNVRLRDRPLRDLNELEWVDGAILANVWRTDQIVRIDPDTGVVTGVIDLSSLRGRLADAPPDLDVLNGIAWDSASRRLFVTGKHWPTLFEIRLRRREGS
jgi:glutamine cyclotransferase